MNESILTSVKKSLGITEEYEHFDDAIIININSVLAILTQLGVGPRTGFRIYNKDAVWSDFLQTDTRLDMVKDFVNLRVKLLFDPPQNASLANVHETFAKELVWRIMIAADQTEFDLEQT